MNLPLASLIVLAYFNVVWQIMLWSYNYLHPILGFMLIIFFPVFAGIAVYIVLESRVPEAWVIPVLISTILFPIIYGISHLTRVPDHIKYVQTGGKVFAGRVSEIDGLSHIYYTLENARIQPGEFGASYDTTRPRQSTTTYHKYFAVPVFDADTGAPPNVFLCDSIRSGMRIDNGSGGEYGLKETELPQVLAIEQIHGRRISDGICRRAVEKYYEKTGISPPGAPIILDIQKENASVYYGKARIHFWLFTALLNALFITLFLFVYRANKSV